MTIDNLKRPVLLGVGIGILALVSFTESVVPPAWRPFVVSVQLYVLIVVVVRDILGRNQEDVETNAQRDKIERKLDDIRFVVEEYEQNRSQSLIDTKATTEALAQELHRAVGVRQEDVDSALQVQTDTLITKIDESTAASAAAAEAAKESVIVSNNVTDKLAAVDRRVEDLNQRILDSLLPKQQLDDIQQVGKESRDILKENLVQADKQSAANAQTASDAITTAADVAVTAAKVASKVAGIAAGQLDSIQETGEATHEIVKGGKGGES